MTTFLANVRAGLTTAQRHILVLAGFGVLAAAAVASWAFSKHAWSGLALAALGGAMCAGIALERMLYARKVARMRHALTEHPTRRELISTGQGGVR